MLETIKSPKDIKKLNIDQLELLAEEIRTEIITTTLKNGGHLASNLGAVELTLAMHYVFDAPNDKIVFDVGHQSYTHKLITGRQKEFASLRKKDGISGFPNHKESEYDTFDAGHSSTAISLALGLARARDNNKENYNILAVVGDGAIGGGMSFEALNDAGEAKNTKLIIVLNDNEMSISKNVGALSSHFANLRATHSYIKGKKRVKNVLQRINQSGKLVSLFIHLRNSLRYLLFGETIFDAMGIKYLGPINGHSLKDMIEILIKAKEYQMPVIIHAVTQKGCGYTPAEDDPENYHGVSSGEKSKKKAESFSSTVGATLCELAETDKKICAITAGMPLNTGLNEFASKFPTRFFDTGIAEQHALAMAGGMTKGGMKPFIVIYSTFLQRGFDQIFHDICLQEAPVTICIDHAGLCGEDGATHQGIYDLGFLRSMPGLIILEPRDNVEMKKMLQFASKADKPVAIRYPKGNCSEIVGEIPFEKPCWDYLARGGKGSVLTFGICLPVGNRLAEELNLNLIDARSLKPFDEKVLLEIADKPIFVLEDNVSVGGLLEGVLKFYSDNKVNVKVSGFSLKDEFVRVGSVNEQMTENEIDFEHVFGKIKNEIR